jgi:acyl carrier protein
MAFSLFSFFFISLLNAFFHLQTREYTIALHEQGHTPYEAMKSWGIGGDAATFDIVELMQEAFPNLIGPTNVYGPTEVSCITVCHIFPRNFKTIVIGRPDPNVHAYICDSKLRPVPVGVPGELLLSGPRLALGYAGRPDLTEEKFIPNPCLDLFADTTHPTLLPYYQKAYRTGDLVRWRSDGTIDFLGRIDRQVKITGVRIELGEVESALESAECVTQAVAVAVMDLHGQKRLVGYVTPGNVDFTSVTAHCRSLLVPAMVPSVVIALESFPLMPNGKVDVQALPAHDWSGSAVGPEEYIAPVDDIEMSVQRAFADVLNRPAEEISMHSDFFALGGSSLQAMRLPALLHEAVGVTISASDVISFPAARQIANILREAMNQEFSGAVEPVVWPDNTRPTSSGQESLCLSYFLNPNDLEVRFQF